MARITEGPMGNIRGKVGNLVVGKWNKTTTVRSKGAPSSKPKTQSQLEQQAKLSVAVQFMRSMKALLSQSFLYHPGHMTGYNAAVRYLLKNAIVGEYPNYTVQYNRVLVSRGDLLHEGNANAAAAPGQVTFTWTYEPTDVLVKPNDLAILVVYCEALNKCVFTVSGAQRSAGTASLAVTRFRGEEVHTWLAFISANGKDTSDSVYTGKLTVS